MIPLPNCWEALSTGCHDQSILQGAAELRKGKSLPCVTQLLNRELGSESGLPMATSHFFLSAPLSSSCVWTGLACPHGTAQQGHPWGPER